MAMGSVDALYVSFSSFSQRNASLRSNPGLFPSTNFSGYHRASQSLCTALDSVPQRELNFTCVNLIPKPRKYDNDREMNLVLAPKTNPWLRTGLCCYYRMATQIRIHQDSMWIRRLQFDQPYEATIPPVTTGALRDQNDQGVYRVITTERS